MPPRDWRLFIADIIDAVEAIRAFTQGLTPERFFADRLRLDAVIGRDRRAELRRPG